MQRPKFCRRLAIRRPVGPTLGLCPLEWLVNSPGGVGWGGGGGCRFWMDRNFQKAAIGLVPSDEKFRFTSDRHLLAPQPELE